MFVSDLQIPFEAKRALDFASYVKRHFKIPDEGCFNVGDETDQYFASMYKKSPEARHTPNSELGESIQKLKEWQVRFPQMKFALSNHGQRWLRKATEAEIPSQMLRRYEDIIGAPPGWRWAKHWRINTKRPMLVEHGDDWGGQFPHVAAALHNGCSTIIGHHHAKAGVEHIRTSGLKIFGMVTGCLIDWNQYAFEYSRGAKFKPQIGLGVVIDNGALPIWLPME